MMNVPGSRVHRSFMGDWRLNQKWANYSPFMGQVVNNQVNQPLLLPTHPTILYLSHTHTNNRCCS